MKERNRRFFS